VIRRAIRGGDALLRRTGARFQMFAAGVFFGLMAVLTRAAALHGFSAGQVATVRFGLGALMALGLFRLRPGTFRPVNRRMLVTRGLLGGLAAFLYFVALSRIPAGEATLLNNTFPVIATVLSIALLGERPTVHIALALLVTSAGVFLVLGGGSLRVGFSWGEAAGVASAILGGAAVTSVRLLRATDNALIIFLAFCLGGLAVSWPFALGPWPAAGTVWLLALGLGVTSFLAQLLMTHAYGALTVPEAAVWQQLTPVTSYLWALGFLGERVTAVEALGVLLGLGGVVYGSVLGRRRGPADAPALAGELPPVSPS
jgi:drug/metabolite transporter (DMT)-like permease